MFLCAFVRFLWRIQQRARAGWVKRRSLVWQETYLERVQNRGRVCVFCLYLSHSAYFASDSDALLARICALFGCFWGHTASPRGAGWAANRMLRGMLISIMRFWKLIARRFGPILFDIGRLFCVVYRYMAICEA